MVTPNKYLHTDQHPKSLAKLLIRLIKKEEDENVFTKFYFLPDGYFDEETWLEFYKCITLAAFQRIAETGSAKVLEWLQKCLVDISFRLTNDEFLFCILADCAICYYSLTMDLRQRYAYTLDTFISIEKSFSEFRNTIFEAKVQEYERKTLVRLLNIITAALNVANGNYMKAYKCIESFLDDYGEIAYDFVQPICKVVPDFLCGCYFHLAGLIACHIKFAPAEKLFAVGFCFFSLVASRHPATSRFLLDLVCGE